MFIEDLWRLTISKSKIVAKFLGSLSRQKRGKKSRKRRVVLGKHHKDPTNPLKREQKKSHKESLPSPPLLPYQPLPKKSQEGLSLFLRRKRDQLEICHLN